MSLPEEKKSISHTSQRRESSLADTSSLSLSSSVQSQNGGDTQSLPTVSPQRTRTLTSSSPHGMTTVESAMTRDPSFEVDWEDDDPENPLNWPSWYKGFVIFSVSFSTLVVLVQPASQPANK
jgi:hypothetical protein